MTRLHSPPILLAIAVVVLAVASEGQAANDFVVRINCGSATSYIDTNGNLWEPDKYFVGGLEESTNATIGETGEDELYTTFRTGNVGYNIPLPSDNTWQVSLYMAETTVSAPNARVFDVFFDNESTFNNIDLIDISGSLDTAVKFTKTHTTSAESNILAIRLVGSTGIPTISAIQVEPINIHLAHSVPQGPYTVVDSDDTGFETLVVDATPSHTHGPGLELVSFEWKLGPETLELSNMATATLTLPVGEHTLTLIVKDSGGNEDVAQTIATVRGAGVPTIDGNINPIEGSIEGGETVTISGTRFVYAAIDTVVKFGEFELTGSDIEIIDDKTIRINSSPAAPTGASVKVDVSVTTPLGESNTAIYAYIADGIPIRFKDGKRLLTLDLILSDHAPTVIQFGPDENLYIGTVTGKLLRVSLSKVNTVLGIVSSDAVRDSEGGDRAILGIAFDPADTSLIFPTVYVSHSTLFHGGAKSSSGVSINGKVSRISGPFLKKKEDVITGLPVSDHDHALNGMTFGDSGELYITVGSSTSGGIPGPLSSTGLLKENVLSAAILVAHNIASSSFRGHLTYDAPDDGNLDPGFDVEVFASGTRNPYDIVKHSNGNLYSFDNGGSNRFGEFSSGCNDGDQRPGETQPDKLLLIEKGAYYGHPNRKRGETDPRQCVWHASSALSDGDYTEALDVVPSSKNGFIEFTGEHFNGQLRGNLIASKYKGSLFRSVLTPDGTGVISTPPDDILGQDVSSLDVVQAPDGTLFVIQYEERVGRVKYFEPDEPGGFFNNLISWDTKIMSIFPTRGSSDGGNLLSIYGVGMWRAFFSRVRVGGNICPILVRTLSKVVCRVPAGSGIDDVSIDPLFFGESAVYSQGYRYITGSSLN